MIVSTLCSSSLLSLIFYSRSALSTCLAVAARHGEKKSLATVGPRSAPAWHSSSIRIARTDHTALTDGGHRSCYYTNSAGHTGHPRPHSARRAFHRRTDRQASCTSTSCTSRRRHPTSSHAAQSSKVPSSVPQFETPDAVILARQRPTWP